MIDHEPEMLGEKPFIVQVVLLVDVVLDRDRRPFFPPARIGRWSLPGRRHHIFEHRAAPVAELVHPAIRDFRRHGDPAASGHGCAGRRSGDGSRAG
jgi:hypothetical protein